MTTKQFFAITVVGIGLIVFSALPLLGVCHSNIANGICGLIWANGDLIVIAGLGSFLLGTVAPLAFTFIAIPATIFFHKKVGTWYPGMRAQLNSSIMAITDWTRDE